MSYPQPLTPEEKLADAKERLNIPRIVAICGSTRFMQEMTEADVRETAAGRIVVKPGCNMKAEHELWADPVEAEALKVRLDGLHRAKIRLADEVLVVGDYVGSSTTAEIAYARSLGKPVRFTHPEVDPGEAHPTTAHRRKETPVPTETTPYRVLVTGSRDWTDVDSVWLGLGDAVGAIHRDAIHREIVIVHGACPTGADQMADEWGRKYGATIERHRAEDFGPWPRCGPIRNRHMVSLGADRCLAFIGPCTSPRCRRPGPHPSHGVSGCADLAEAAGIPVRRFTA